MHGWIVSHGVHPIRNFEPIAVPLVIIVGIMATIWGLQVGYGLGLLFSQPSHLSGASGWLTFATGITGLLGTWCTFAVNIPDLSRFVRSERDQVLGQLIGLPITAAVFTLMSVIVTSSTVIVFGKPIWDTVALLLAIGHPAILIFGGITVMVATLSVNIAANIMPACYDLVNLFPRRLTFNTAETAVLVIGLLFCPWLWFKNADSIFKVLSGIGGVLGPVTGIMLTDDFGLRHQQYDVADLYRYAAADGWNFAGITAFVIGGIAAWSGLIVSELAPFYAFSWFIGVAVGAIVYLALSRGASTV